VHLFKYLVGELVKPPLFLSLMLIVAGALWLLRRRRAAGVLLVTSLTLAYLASTGLVANALLKPLTGGYRSPLDHPPPLRYVVVLGAAYNWRPELPVTASLESDGLPRIVEGVRLLRLLPPGARLVVSGGSTDGHLASARGYAAMAATLGVDPASIIRLETPLDTASEAREIAKLLHAEPFLLVTSSDSMWRAMQLMEREGAHAVPAPATPVASPFDWDQLLPSARAMSDTQVCIHEYVGLAAIALGLD
jgi:uncharacterized SAM-binding protein YcdF (DUF218 family)